MVFPVLSSSHFPVRLRIALAALIAVIVAPSIPGIHLDDWGLSELVLLLFKEISVGLVIGFVSRLVFHALEFFAGILGVEVGLNTAAIFNPMTDARSEVFGMVVFNLGAMLLFTLDLHHWMLASFQRTYAAVPIGAAAATMPLYYGFTARVADVFQAGLLMAAPVLAVTFLISVTFALISRAVPTMNVFAESFSFRVLGGLLVFAMTLHLTSQHICNYLRRLPEDVLRLARMMNPT